MRTIFAIALALSILATTAFAAVLASGPDKGHSHDWRDQQPADLELLEAALDAAVDAANALLGS